MRTAKLSVPEGALLHEMGGDVDEPSQVKSIGNVPPSSMAELETVNSLAGVSEGADEVVVVVVVAEPEQAEPTMIKQSMMKQLCRFIRRPRTDP